MDIIKEATDSGYLSPDRLQDYKHARDRIGAPEVSDEEFNQDRAEKKAQAEELQKRLDEKRTQLEQQQQQKDKNQPPLSLEEKPAFSRLNGLDSFFVEV